MRTKSEEVMQQIVDYIDDCYFRNSGTPTMQEIAEYIGLDKSNISRYVKEMSARGLLDISKGWRSIRTGRINKTLSDIRRIPVVGEIACGTPLLAEENIESYLTISASFLGSGNFFALRAKGNSMINANINDGDFVVVRQQNSADEGQIIVALIDDCATLKRFYKDRQKRKIRLHPENDEMEDMYYTQVDIQGVVKKVIKDVE